MRKLSRHPLPILHLTLTLSNVFADAATFFVIAPPVSSFQLEEEATWWDDDGYGGGDLYAGFDLGTSGARISVIERTTDKNRIYNEIYSDSIRWNENDDPESNRYNDPKAWMNAVQTLLSRTEQKAAAASKKKKIKPIKSICISGTSASCLMIDTKNAGTVTRSPRMYNYDISSPSTYTSDSDRVATIRAIDLMDKYAPPKHTARSNTGTLAKLLRWLQEKPSSATETLCHQSDYISMKLTSHPRKKCGSGPSNHRLVLSDYHNCLKLGYNVRTLSWPSWLHDCLRQGCGIQNPDSILPYRVVSPGEPMGRVSDFWVGEYPTILQENTVVVGGTTDSNAAFFAAAMGGGVKDVEYGTAVTSLGSTLALKFLSREYVEDSSLGVYSHRFPLSLFQQNSIRDDEGDEAWLVGGASNVGCAVLRQQKFSDSELIELSRKIDPAVDSSLSYYPLVKVGERFPIADSNKQPLVTPVPEERSDFLHGILDGISNVERDGFSALGKLGAEPRYPKVVWTCGGGSKNHIWTKMRQRKLSNLLGDDHGSIVVKRAKNTEASFGAAILASATFR